MKADSLILKGFRPDPSVIRVGDTFYVANSTFEWFPGVEIHESKDLLHWKLTGHPLSDTRLLDMTGIQNSCGVWAPCLSYDKGMFYLVYSIVHTFDEMTQDNDNFLTTAADIHGPWSDPVYLNSGGFDASLFHDRNGTKWLVNMIWDETINRNHFHGIELQEYDPAAGKLVGPRENIYRGTETGLTEGPHLYQKDGWYYLLTAEGGTSEAHCVMMARSRNLAGPYEADPEGAIVSSHGKPDAAIQYAGHGDIVEDEHGNWFLFHLGSRKKLFDGYSVFGRETFLQNAGWTKEGWLRLPEGSLPKETVEIPDDLLTPDKNDNKINFYKTYNFDTPKLDPDFMTLRIPLGEDQLSLTERPGFLRLKGRESLSSRYRQSLVAVRIQEPEFTICTSLDFDPDDIRQRAGLIFYYHTANYYYLYLGYQESQGRFLQVIKRDSKKTELMLAEPVILPETGRIGLRGDFTPQGIMFFWRNEEGEITEWMPLKTGPEKMPVRILSDEYANLCGEQGFTGAFTGLCTQDLTGRKQPADFKSMEMKPLI